MSDLQRESAEAVEQILNNIGVSDTYHPEFDELLQTEAHAKNGNKPPEEIAEVFGFDAQ